jgi:inosine/xanthosine triphosphate pyrophosphatase family protein
VYAQAVLGDVQQLDVDLPEIQDLDARTIIREKLAAARRHRATELLVEDTSLYFQCLNGLPGPLIKWFLQALGDEGLYHLVHRLGNDQAVAKTVIGYADPTGRSTFSRGQWRGISCPRGVSTALAGIGSFSPMARRKPSPK